MILFFRKYKTCNKRQKYVIQTLLTVIRIAKICQLYYLDFYQLFSFSNFLNFEKYNLSFFLPFGKYWPLCYNIQIQHFIKETVRICFSMTHPSGIYTHRHTHNLNIFCLRHFGICLYVKFCSLNNNPFYFSSIIGNNIGINRNYWFLGI